MSPKEKPTILFIDDVVEEIDALARECEDRADVVKRSFDDVEPADLDIADLVLVDFNLKDWNARERAPEVTLRPWDGLAVAEILRSYYRGAKSQRPVAFAVLSGDLASLTSPFPPTSREHMVASLVKVEWAFPKDKPLADLSRQLISLANGVRALPQKWPSDSNTEKDKILQSLLAVPDTDWAAAAIGDVSRCHPPIQELSTWSHGLAFLRWMLQRILPYPTFLLDDTQVALRIGISVESFCAAMQANKDFADWLRPALFEGVLHEFRKRRWWRAGVDALIWELSVEKPFSRELVAVEVKVKAPDAVFLAQKNPVACVDKDYEFVGFGEAQDCVRLRPDDWPLFADSAWAEKAVVMANQSLLMAVEEATEREELGAKEQ